MRAFKNTKVTKSELMAVLYKHAEMDNFTQGQYWEDGKGCDVGCMLQSFTDETNNHSLFPDLFGIPEVIARLSDSIFEGLSNEDAKWWPIARTEAINEGSDLSVIWPKFAVWLLEDVIRYSSNKKVVQDVIDLYKRKIAGEDVSSDEFRVVRAAAAAAYAADAVAAAYAAAAADAVAAAYAAARQNKRKEQALKLIELLKECKQ